MATSNEISILFQLLSTCIATQDLQGGAATSADCDIVFNDATTMDFENANVAQKPYFDIIVQIVDAAGITNDMVLQFKLQNLNDEEPVFFNTPYMTTVAENTVRG